MKHQIKITGTSRNRERTVAVSVKRVVDGDTIVRWTDGRNAKLEGTKVWRMNGSKYQTLMTDAFISGRA